MNICLIDDDTVFGFYLTKRLSQLGFKSTHFENYRQVIEKQLFHFDLYIIDIHLEKENGIDFVRFLKNNHKSSSIFISSGNISEKIRTELTDLGVNDFFLKPYSSECLQKKIQNLQ